MKKVNVNSTAINLATGLSLMASVFPLSVAAQSSLMLEEVVVTATKREASLQSVGVSATAFNSEQLKQLGLETSGDMASYAPNIEYKRLWGAKGNNALFFIRGVGQADFNEGSESPATVYVDDFYVISNSAVDFLMHDVQRAEMLRGPQGTLFGRNSTAGAINITNNRPIHEFEADLAVNIGNYNRREFRGMVNLPLVEDSLAFRLAFDLDKNDAHTKNKFTGGGPGAKDINDSDFRSYRAMLQWDPTENVSVFYKTQYGEVDSIGAGDQSNPVRLVPGGVAPAATDAFGYSERVGGVGSPEDVRSDGKNKIDNEVKHHLLNISWDINENTVFSSITGYFDQEKTTFEECDGSPRSQCFLRQLTDQDYITQEFRLAIDTDKSRWTFGTYYLDQDYFNYWHLGALSGSGTNEALGFEPNTPGGLIQVTPNNLDVKTFSVYGNWAYDLSDTLTLTAGVRWNKEEKDFSEDEGLFLHDYPDTGTSSVNGGPEFGFVSLDHEGFDDLLANHITGAADPNIHFEDKYSDSFVSYKLQADWTPSDTLLIYGSFRHGVKAGGFNNGLVNFTPDVLSEIEFDKEVNDAWELGWKWSFYDGLARLNGALFYYDYSDYQASAFLGSSSSIGTFVLNADATSQGAELEFTVSPTEGLDVQLTAGYIDTEVKDITNVGSTGEVTKDRELGHAPKFQASGLIRYAWELGNSSTLATQVSYSWIDDRFVDVLNDSGTALDSYGEGNASLTYTSADSNWYAKAYIKNFTDKRGEGTKFSLVGLGGAGQINYIAPRRYGIELGYNW